ncbi:putative transmembrane protein [Cavenderia fasciculata]|uniref:Transmembrane protein n=1 Tax=Cavenderia fasciculata TaxID=261658 RepID=F4Q2W3_CACFS|nr:putative transmembrane protein [Cavenderia fasciculata]EGG16739.1 putative transmembrane protein [Cavenderia fasciculata]|eukprot:XP_004355213.1 putative transmembrane protein [Cavenderia fasciculata]
MGGICESVERPDFSCSFCKALFTQSFDIAGNGEASLVFNVLVDTMAIGYLFSALYLFFRLQRSYNYIMGSNMGDSGASARSTKLSNSQNKTTSNENKDYVQINVLPTGGENSALWDKNTSITINHPKILMSTYFKHLLFVGGWLAVEGLLLLFLPPSSIVYPTAVTIIMAGHIITDNWVLIFMAGKKDDEFSSRRSFYICILLYLLLMATQLADVFGSPMCKTPFECQLFMTEDPYTALSTNVVFMIIYTTVLLVSLRRSIVRPTARLWLVFLMAVNFLAVISNILLIFKIDFAYCFLAFSTIPYALLYGFMLFRTVGNDSNLLRARSEFEPLLTNFREYQNLFGKESISSLEGTNALQMSAFYIKFTEFKFGEVIGGGYFGEVKKAIWKGAVVAVKMLHRNSYRNTENTEDNVFFKEVAILSMLRHPNVLQFMGVCSEDDKNCIVTEYMGGGSLDRFLTDRHFILVSHPELAWRIATDVAKDGAYGRL